MIALIKDVNWESRCRKKKTARWEFGLGVDAEDGTSFQWHRQFSRGQKNTEVWTSVGFSTLTPITADYSGLTLTRLCLEMEKNLSVLNHMSPVLILRRFWKEVCFFSPCSSLVSVSASPPAVIDVSRPSAAAPPVFSSAAPADSPSDDGPSPPSPATGLSLPLGTGGRGGDEKDTVRDDSKSVKS